MLMESQCKFVLLKNPVSGLEPSRKMETRVCNLLFTIGLTMFSLPNPPNNERTQKCGHKAPD